MLSLESPIEQLSGVGEKLTQKFKGAGLNTVRDLFFYYPRKWDDFRNVTPIKWLRVGEEVTVKGKIIEVKKEYSPKKRMAIVSALVEDESGSIKAVWFNQPFMARMLRANLPITLHAKVDFSWQSKEKVLSSPVWVKEEKIVPVYSEVGGLPSRLFERLVLNNLSLVKEITDWLPEEIKEEEDLIDLPEALRQIHKPSSFEALKAAKERLAFDELFLIALSMAQIKKENQQDNGIQMEINKDALKEFASLLPFKLTDAQRKTAWEIIQDLDKPYPMNRLLEGDVGSGKTVVAALAALNVVKGGYQVAWLAPTEILARQHYKNVAKLMEPFKIPVALVTGSVKEDHTKAEIAIGTHALVQENIHFPRLGMVIVDEQHRFGVAQRAALRNRNEKMPHLLSMTATPIPRTLALALYGDLDISVIDQMPEGRQKVETKVVQPEKRENAYQFIKKQVEEGRQVFIVCPLIEDKQDEKLKTKNKKLQLEFWEIEKKSVTKEYEKLSKEIFPELSIGLLHGRMRPKEKDAVMRDFAEGKLNILVSTAVVEVGIDIPNATVMMIEGAERFGLAQLHQFRGRVGRGSHQSYCLLFAESWSENTKARLKAMVECSNGFELAEKDLQLRGPGELTGLRQSGLPDLKMASLTDIILVRRARKSADKIVEKGIDAHPLLQARLMEFQQTRHLE